LRLRLPCPASLEMHAESEPRPNPSAEKSTGKTADVLTNNGEAKVLSDFGYKATVKVPLSKRYLLGQALIMSPPPLVDAAQIE